MTIRESRNLDTDTNTNTATDRHTNTATDRHTNANANANANTNTNTVPAPPRLATYVWRCAYCHASGSITVPWTEPASSLTARIHVSHTRKNGSFCRWNEDHVRLRRIAA